MKLFDTSAWIEYFRGSEKGRIVKDLLEKEEIFTSAISLAEIARWFSQNKGDVEKAIKQVQENAIVLPLQDTLLVESGKIYVEVRKSKKKFGLIDAIIYVTAQMHDLDILTQDRDFKGLPNVELL